MLTPSSMLTVAGGLALLHATLVRGECAEYQYMHCALAKTWQRGLVLACPRGLLQVHRR